jgi:hypothetical protein
MLQQLMKTGPSPVGYVQCHDPETMFIGMPVSMIRNA